MRRVWPAQDMWRRREANGLVGECGWRRVEGVDGGDGALPLAQDGMDAADSEVHVVEERAACSCPGVGKNYRRRPITALTARPLSSTLSSATRDADANAREWLRLLAQISRDFDHCHHRDA